MKQSISQTDTAFQRQQLNNPGGLAFGIYCTIASMVFYFLDATQEEPSIATLISLIFNIGSFAVGYRLFRNLIPVIDNSRIANYMRIQLIMSSICIPILAILGLSGDEEVAAIGAFIILLLLIAIFVFELLIGIALRKVTEDPTGGLLRKYGTTLLVFTPIAIFFDLLSAFEETGFSTVIGTLAESVPEILFILVLIRFRRIMPPRENTRGQAAIFTLLAMLTLALLKITLNEIF